MSLSKFKIRLIIFIYAIALFFTGVGCSRKSQMPPILILARQSDFGTYTGEILKAEGFNEFIIDSLSGEGINTSFLSRFKLIILSEQAANGNDVKMIRTYLQQGGNIIAIEPAGSLCDIFGIEKTTGKIGESVIEIDTLSVQGKGLSGRRIQNHLVSDAYKLKNAEALAWFHSETFPEKEFPAVVTSGFGKGNTAAFLYNLPRNIVYIRQGNPDAAGLEKDGIPGLRAMDMFTDGWIDTSNNTINQADEQMTLLSHCIENIHNNEKPLPRLWYFPDTLKCLVTLTNDGEFRGENDFENQFRDVDSMGAKMSLYILETGKVTRQWSDKWSAKGFEISGHPDDTREAATPVWENMDNVLEGKVKEVTELYGLKMKTVVNHWFVWCGNDPSGRAEFASQAEIEAAHGLGLDINYAHYDNNSGQGHFLGPAGSGQGNFTGSGLPMRFASSNGKIIDIYQQLNNVYDQQYNENHDAEGFFNCFRGLMDRSLYGEVFSYISIKSHNDEYYFSKAPLLRMLEYARVNSIPVWTAAQLLDFIKMRDEASFSGLEWTGTSLSFNLNSAVNNINGLTYLVPYTHGRMKIKSVEVDGKAVPFIIRSLKGFDYAFSTVHPGNNYSILVSYGN